VSEHHRPDRRLRNEWSGDFRALWNADTADGGLPPAPSPFAATGVSRRQCPERRVGRAVEAAGRRSVAGRANLFGPSAATWTMVDRRGPWSPDEIELFLAEATVPIRLACNAPSGSPWMLSLWYRFEDDAFHCATKADADVVELLDGDDRVALEVSTNGPPYRGVRGRGRATVTPDEGKALLRDLLERYLGGTDSPLADQLLDPDREEVRIRIDPDRLVSWDYSTRMGGGAGG
jgi:nitroimidazol reductase NimA-like FMN-containing flavoprotein (pyridoxamine 5'-phosphate oxidase superfamily)